MISAIEALDRLQQGNRRFTEELMKPGVLPRFAMQRGLPGDQEPFAIILGCADSRVPAEFVFDQGLGDLFVIRVAGNIVAPSQIGSVEFAAAGFGTRLVVVLGHTECGAVKATVDDVRHPKASPSASLRHIVDAIRPHVVPLHRDAPHVDEETLVARAVRANIMASANKLRHGSPIVEELIREDGLLVVGAEYCLASGKVEFFDGMPKSSVD